MFANRIQNYFPATRVAQAWAPAAAATCASFAMVPMGMVGATSGVQGVPAQSIYEIALEAARREVSAKRRFRLAARNYWATN